jgi:glutathione S-transferase
VTAVRLYVVPGSHPSMTGRLMLAHKGIAYRRVDLIPALHKPILRALGFPRNTVPALRIDGRRIQGTLEISRALDTMRPHPPLFPADPTRRAAVERVERWGEGVLQPVPRRLSWWALGRDRSTIHTFLEGARMVIPNWLAVKSAAPIVWLEMRINGARDTVVREDLGRLPAMLDQVDGWMREGILGGEERNAADFQIATSIRLLLCFDDLRPLIEKRRAAGLAERLVPSFPGRVPRVIPTAWLC